MAGNWPIKTLVAMAMTNKYECMHTHTHACTCTHNIIIIYLHTLTLSHTAIFSNIPTLTFAEDISTDGVILQRFPATDRKEAALPAGIAMVGDSNS